MIPETLVQSYKNSPYRLRLRAILILINLVVLLELPLLINTSNASDYKFHIESAAALSQGIEIDFPHRLYTYVTIAIQTVLPGASFQAAAVFASTLFYIVLACVAATSYHRQLRGRHPWQAVALAVSLLLMAPVFIFDFANDVNSYSFVYLQFTYHNPTSTAMRTMAVIVFLYAACALLPPRVPWKDVMAGAVFTYALGNAKPSYNMAFVPAAVVVTFYRMIRKLFVDLRMLVTILSIMVFLLVIQYVTTINVGGPIQGLAIVPFGFLYDRGFSLADILVKHTLSMLFPIVVLILYWRSARTDALLGLAWLTFCAGMFISLFLVERGTRLTHGNFYWSGEVTLFVLFFASVHFWIRAMGGRLDFKEWRARIIGGVWGLHLISGIYWYLLHLTAQY